MIKIALTHDVDRVTKHYQYFTHSLKSLSKLQFNRFFYHFYSVFIREPYWNFSEIIEIENIYNVKSTFFFLHETIGFDFFDKNNWKLSLGRYRLTKPQITEIIEWLDKNGWEIGLHGSFISFKNKNLLLKEKELLEKIVGHEVIGIRQHYLNLDENTWKIQKEIGFKYDSSFGYTKDIGYKDNQYNHFFPLNDEFVVFPLVIMDNCFMKKQKKWDEFFKIIDIAEKKDSLLVINWHQRVFNNNEFPEYKEAYIRIIEECKMVNAKFVTLKDYYTNFIKK